jgi:hypothetical protein
MRQERVTTRSRRVGTAAALAACLTAAPAPGVAAQLEFDDARIRIEVNSTDGDAGIQMDVDGEAWESLGVVSPDGRRILEIAGRSSVARQWLTELFFESEEPSFDELSLEELFERFPAGRYEVVGRTVDGRRIVGTARLTHDIPAGPVILAPAEDALVSKRNAVIAWLPVTRPAGVRIVGYQVIVEREDPIRTFEATVPASVTSVTVPSEFLEEDTEYTFEVLALEEGGNQTISESSFVTR